VTVKYASPTFRGYPFHSFGSPSPRRVGGRFVTSALMLLPLPRLSGFVL